MEYEWYKCIEEPVRELVKKLRNNGINTFCSCGHAMWIQCETTDPSTELDTIYNVMHELGIDTYSTVLTEFVRDGVRDKYIEISLPDKDGQYHWRMTENPRYESDKGTINE